MVTNNQNSSARLSRRGLLRGVGLAGLGAAVAAPRPAHASIAPTPGSKPRTDVLEASGGEALLRTGPFQTFAAKAGSRVGVCLLAGGGVQAGGPLPLIRGVAAAHTDVAGIDGFQADQGVERSVYRLLGALDVVRPVQLYGLSATISEDVAAGDLVEITWLASLRRAAADGLSGYLDRYHACVFGELSAASTFKSRLSYVEISRRA